MFIPDPDFSPSRIRGLKKHRIPDPAPQHSDPGSRTNADPDPVQRNFRIICKLWIISLLLGLDPDTHSRTFTTKKKSRQLTKIFGIFNLTTKIDPKLLEIWVGSEIQGNLFPDPRIKKST
jgi:hypothetical protein